MLEKDKRVRIIAGHYGSGKTEFAVNYAVALSKNAPRVVLADLDIVNVFSGPGKGVRSWRNTA